MSKFRVIGKIATGLTAVSIIFAIIAAVLEYNYYTLVNAYAATMYAISYALARMLPYLFVAIGSLIVAVISRSAVKAKNEEESKPTEPNY